MDWYTSFMLIKIGFSIVLPCLLLIQSTLMFFDSGGRYEFIRWEQNIIKYSFLGLVLGIIILLLGFWKTP